jgi:hypothetical protein
MRRQKSKLADTPAVPEAVTQVSTKAVEAAGEVLEDLAERAAVVAERASSALGDVAEPVPPRRKRHPFRWMLVIASVGGAAYVAVRAGVPAKVKSMVGGGNGQPATEFEPSTLEPTAGAAAEQPPAPSINVTGTADATPAEQSPAAASGTDGSAPEPAGSETGRGGTPG